MIFSELAMIMWSLVLTVIVSYLLAKEINRKELEGKQK